MPFCACHQNLRDVDLVVMLEKDATKCDSLWVRWCAVHQDEIEREVMAWLNKHSLVGRIMKLRDLPKEQRNIGNLGRTKP